MSAVAITITPPDASAIKAEYATVLARAIGITITTVEEHAGVLAYRGVVARARKAVLAKIDPICASANATHKMLTALRNEVIAPFDASLAMVDAELNRHEAEAKRIAAEERRIIEEAARKEAEDRQRIEAERIAAEAKARKEAADAAAKAAREDGDRKRAALIKAQALVDAAAAEQARLAVLAAPVIVAPVHVAPALAVVKGQTSRPIWHGECFDVVALARHVVAHPEDARYLQAHAVNLNEWARDTEGKGDLPGCKAVSETSRRST